MDADHGEIRTKMLLNFSCFVYGRYLKEKYTAESYSVVWQFLFDMVICAICEILFVDKTWVGQIKKIYINFLHYIEQDFANLARQNSVYENY